MNLIFEYDHEIFLAKSFKRFKSLEFTVPLIAVAEMIFNPWIMES